MPKRIQRKRTKGWRLPDNAVIVTRPGPWGNPFIVTTKMAPGSKVAGGWGYIAVATIEDAMECFRILVTDHPEKLPPLSELRGKDLACFCRLDQPCHADVLLEFANRPDSGAAEG